MASDILDNSSKDEPVPQMELRSHRAAQSSLPLTVIAIKTSEQTDTNTAPGGSDSDHAK